MIRSKIGRFCLNNFKRKYILCFIRGVEPLPRLHQNFLLEPKLWPWMFSFHNGARSFPCSKPQSGWKRSDKHEIVGTLWAILVSPMKLNKNDLIYVRPNPHKINRFFPLVPLEKWKIKHARRLKNFLPHLSQI